MINITAKFTFFTQKNSTTQERKFTFEGKTFGELFNKILSEFEIHNRKLHIEMGDTNTRLTKKNFDFDKIEKNDNLILHITFFGDRKFLHK